MMKVLLCSFVLLAAVGHGILAKAETWAISAPPADTPLGQLPDTITPQSYQIDLTIDPATEAFSGHVSIRAKLNAAADHIWLHGERMTVAKTTVTLADGQQITARYEPVGKTGVAAVRFDRELPAQAVTLDFDYSAPFDRTLNGLYLVEDGGERYAFTQMESHYARKAFPSFDEPRFKVPFTVSLTVRKAHAAIANTPVTAEKDLGNGWKRLSFAPTKPLPTYLLAWAVGNLDVVDWKAIPASRFRDREIPLRGVATHGKGKQLAYALENTAGIVQTLEDYFAIAYPYEKLDILAVPDFESGAMENAGAITYREQLLLMDENAPLQQKRAYVSVHMHELAHQWFGNLVTTQWWNDIWLNEAFASWMENKGVNRFAPKMGFDLSNQQDAAGAMRLDALASMRQIRQPILKNTDISSAFDGITYSKGAAVITMFENFVGEDTFQRGVHNYLEKYAFGNATAEQFVAAIAEAAGDDRVNAAFFSFLTQIGVPDVALTQTCKAGKVSATLSQSRYLPLGSAASRDQRWQVPVCVTAYGAFAASKHCTLLTEREQAWAFTLPSCPSHVMPNANGAGYYRYSLDEPAQAALVAGFESLPVTEAYVLADNLNAAFRAGRVDVNGFLAAIPAIARHPSQQVATLPLGTLGFIKEYLTKADDLAALQRHFAALYQPRLDAIGITPKAGDSADIRLLRNALVDFLSDSAHSAPVRAQLVDWGKAYIGFESDHALHPDALPADLIGQALAVAAQELGNDYFDALQTHFNQTSDGTVRDYLISAMASADEPERVAQMRSLMTDKALRTNERMTIAFGQMDTLERADAFFQWFKGNYRPLLPLLPESMRKRLPMLASRYCSAEQAEVVRGFFQPLAAEIPGSERSLNNTLESIGLCSALVKAQPAISAAVLAPTAP